jgi:dTDP-4-amino-4,6-dideoxygalactose transaminase
LTTSDAVPLIDLRRSLDSYRSDANRAFTRVLESQHFILGEEVAAFERELAAWLGVEDAVGCGSGSDAIALALQSLDVGRGAEVVTTPFTFIATVSAIVRVGARPVLVDVDPQTLCPDADATASALTPRTRAVIPVHLYGQSADLGPVLAATEPRGIAVVEDAAQALGARFGKSFRPRTWAGSATGARSRRTGRSSRRGCASCAITVPAAATTTTRLA